MRVAVLGAGTAGHMAVAHVAHYLPWASITHFYDPGLPPIGVGEGTTPVFTEWAERVLGWDLEFLREHCDATPKAGIQFEGWGAPGETYTHFFGSTEGQACHLSASLLAQRLAARSTATVVPQPIRSIAVRDHGARLDFGNESLDVDCVFDARGFPEVLDDRHVGLSCVPTSCALLTRGAPRAPRDRTRAVARPHGWVFVIPLGSETAYGYVHHHSETDEARVDFEAFLSGESVDRSQPVRALRFPNFRRRTLLDGTVFAIGNRAGFIEPLEATALGMVVLQLNVATLWILDRALGRGGACADAANRALATTMDEGAAFVGWHYALGSRHESAFWSRAAESFDAWLRDRDSTDRSRFESYVQRGIDLPSELAFADSVAEVDRVSEPLDTSLDTYGGFLDLSFAKVAHGIGWAASGPEADPM